MALMVMMMFEMDKKAKSCACYSPQLLIIVYEIKRFALPMPLISHIYILYVMFTFFGCYS